MPASPSLFSDRSTISLINFFALVLSSIIFSVFYVKSVQPAAMERNNCNDAYQVCARHRLISSIFMAIASFNYVVYYFFPLPVANELLQKHFAWPYWVSVAIALTIGIPCAVLMYRGIVDAGEETMTPKKEHQLYGGIYDSVRHPQAIGEMPLWWTFAFLLNSPFLVAFSCLYIPVWIIFCRMEEMDLTIRYGSSYEEYRKRVGFLFPKRTTAVLTSKSA